MISDRDSRLMPQSLEARSAARMRCGVAGISSIDTPNGDSASLTALSTAAGAPMAPPSPKTLGAGDGGCRRRFDVMQLDRRDFARSRRHVVGKGRGLHIAERVVDDLLEQRVADALRDAAVHLAVGDQRIDDAAGILDHEEFLERNAAGLDVDFDDGDMTGIGEGAGRIVIGAFTAGPA